MNKFSLLLVGFMIIVSQAFSVVTIQVWHSYRDRGKKAIEAVADAFNISQSEIKVQLLAVPFNALNDSLRAKIPVGNGPDVFMFPHDFVGAWAENNIIIPIESHISPEYTKQYFKHTVEAFNYMYDEALWALPTSFANIALYYNKNLVKNPPQKMSKIIELAKKFTKPKHGQMGKWGFAYETGNFYFHTMWVQGFGGKIFRKIGTSDDGFPIFLPLLYSKPMIRATEYVKNTILSANVCPPNPNSPLISRLFNTGNAMFIISGQWFRGEVDSRINYGVTQLPIIDSIDKRAVPFLTIEGMFMSACCRDQEASIKVIKYFTSAAMGKMMAKKCKQTPANKGAYKYAVVKDDKISRIFISAAKSSIPMPNSPEMALTWNPATIGLNDILGGGNSDTVWKKKQIELMKSIENYKKAKGMYKKLGYDYNNMSKPLSVK